MVLLQKWTIISLQTTRTTWYYTKIKKNTFLCLNVQDNRMKARSILTYKHKVESKWSSIRIWNPKCTSSDTLCPTRPHLLNISKQWNTSMEDTKYSNIYQRHSQSNDYSGKSETLKLLESKVESSILQVVHIGKDSEKDYSHSG